MIDLKYRIDFVRLENESMPDGENINDGSTCYIIDTGELYIYYKGTWYNSDIDKQSESEQSENQQNESEQRENQPSENKQNEESIIENEITKAEEVIVNDK